MIDLFTNRLPEYIVVYSAFTAMFKAFQIFADTVAKKTETNTDDKIVKKIINPAAKFFEKVCAFANGRWFK